MLSLRFAFGLAEISRKGAKDTGTIAVISSPSQRRVAFASSDFLFFAPLREISI